MVHFSVLCFYGPTLKVIICEKSVKFRQVNRKTTAIAFSEQIMGHSPSYTRSPRPLIEIQVNTKVAKLTLFKTCDIRAAWIIHFSSKLIFKYQTKEMFVLSCNVQGLFWTMGAMKIDYDFSIIIPSQWILAGKSFFCLLWILWKGSVSKKEINFVVHTSVSPPALLIYNCCSILIWNEFQIKCSLVIMHWKAWNSHLKKRSWNQQHLSTNVISKNWDI